MGPAKTSIRHKSTDESFTTEPLLSLWPGPQSYNKRVNRVGFTVPDMHANDFRSVVVSFLCAVVLWQTSLFHREVHL